MYFGIGVHFGIRFWCQGAFWVGMRAHVGAPLRLLGCPLSPLMGALFLKPLDDLMGRMGLFYVRFMDDWVILTPTRWKLRGAVRAVQVLMGELKLVLHPDKTFIGRISRGFDFLGYWFTPEGLGIASKSVERFAERVSLLYEQGAGENRIEEYVRRWWRWVRCGVGLLLGVGCCRLDGGLCCCIYFRHARAT